MTNNLPTVYEVGTGLSIERKGFYTSILQTLKCHHKVISSIIGGITTPRDVTHRISSMAYIAGGMRGYADYNFRAFDDARDHLLNLGYSVISPADIDRTVQTQGEHINISESRGVFGTVYRDTMAISMLAVDTQLDNCLVMLPDWENSTGARAEFFLAQWLGMPTIDAITLNQIKAGVQINGMD